MENYAGLLQAIEFKDYLRVSTILDKQGSQAAVTGVLEHGCKNGDNRLVKIALQNISGSIWQIDNEKYLLYTACSKGYANIAYLLLKNGAQVDLKSKNGWSALMIASKKGHVEVVRILLKKGTQVNMQEEKGLSALMLASKYGHAEVVKILLENGAQVNMQTENGGSALMIASSYGHVKIVKLLLKNGADVNMQKKNGRFALMVASHIGHAEIVRVLLQNGAQVNRLNKKGESALMIASEYGHAEVVRILLDKGAEVNMQEENGMSAIILASKKGDAEVVKILLENGAQVNMQNEDGESALMIASQDGHAEIVKILLENRAEVNMQKKTGLSALMLASMYDHTNVVILLLEKGAQVNMQNENGGCALTIASSYGHVKVVNILLKKGADVNMQKKNGRFALMIAGNNNHAEVVQVLLQNGAQINMLNEDGESALMIASRDGHAKIVKVLLENGAEVNMQKKTGLSALMLASMYGHAEIVKILLEKGAQVNMQQEDGRSALMLASQNGHSEVVKILLKNGAQVNMQEENGWSAMMIASKSGCVNIVEILENGAQVNMQEKCGWSALMIASGNGNINVVRVLIENGAHLDLLGKDGLSAIMIAKQLRYADIAKLLQERLDKLQHPANVPTVWEDNIDNKEDGAAQSLSHLSFNEDMPTLPDFCQPDSDIFMKTEMATINEAEYPSLPVTAAEDKQQTKLQGLTSKQNVSATYEGKKCSIDWKENGLQLQFEGNESLKCDNTPIHIATVSGGYSTFPNRVKPVSRVYHIHCPRQLKTSVTIRIQHNALTDDVDNLCFFTCKDDHPPYNYQFIQGGIFTSEYGEIVVSSFSSFRIGQVFSKFIVRGVLSLLEKSYEVSLYCSITPHLLSTGEHYCNIYMSVVRNCEIFKVCAKSYIKEYEEDVKLVKGYTVHFNDTDKNINVEFACKSEDARFDEPDRSYLRKKDISRYVDACPPHLKYTLHYQPDHPVEVKFKLNGLKGLDKLTMHPSDLPDASTANPMMSDNVNGHEKQDTAFSMKNLQVLKISKTEELYLIEAISPQWEKASELLGFRTTRIGIIKADNLWKGVEACCHAIMNHWLTDSNPRYNYTRSWEGMHTLLKDLQLAEVARNLSDIVFKR